MKRRAGEKATVTSSRARWAGLAATAASFALAAGAAEAQTVRYSTARDPTLPDPPRTSATEPLPPGLVLQPRAGVQMIATDNVYLEPTNHKTDLVTKPSVGLAATYSGGRASGILDFNAAYDSYSRAHELNDVSLNALATGEYSLVPRFLSFGLDGAITNGNLSGYGTPTIDRSGIAGRTQVINVAAGPRLTTTLGDMVDLNAVARVRWVGYNASDDTTASLVPRDSTIREASVGATTADRYATHEVAVTGQYEADDNDFRLYTGIASFYYRVAPSIRVLARAGYDDIHQPGIVNIKSEILSGGVEYQINARSYVRVEAGRRYDDFSMAAETLIEITDRFYMTGSYTERVLPAQITLNDSFLRFVTDTEVLPAPLSASRFGIGGNLNSDTSKDKVAELRGVYTWSDQQISFGASWIGRRVLNNNSREETVLASAVYYRRMRPDLATEVSVDYQRTLDSQLFGTTRTFNFVGRLIYDLNPTVRFTGGYGYSNDQQASGGGRLIENVAFLGFSKTF